MATIDFSRRPPFDVVVWCAYKARDQREYTLEIGQVITVHELEKRGAWFGTKTPTRTCWFPASYTRYADTKDVVIAPTSQESVSASDSGTSGGAVTLNYNAVGHRAIAHSGNAAAYATLTRPKSKEPDVASGTKGFKRSKSVSQSERAKAINNARIHAQQQQHYVRPPVPLSPPPSSQSSSNSPAAVPPPSQPPPPLPPVVTSSPSSTYDISIEQQFQQQPEIDYSTASTYEESYITSPEPSQSELVDNIYITTESELPLDTLPPPIVKDQKQRLMTIKEIVETEIEYNRDLKTLDNIRTRLTEKKLLPSDVLSQIFSNVTGLSNVNQLIEKKIEEEKVRIGDSDESLLHLPLGQIYRSLAPFLKMYLQYCEDHDNALIVLAKHKKKHKPLDNWLNQEAEKCKGLYLKDYLIKPIQRLCKYPLLFQNLLSLTPEDDPDYTSLQETLGQINDIVMDINEIRGKNANFSTLCNYEENIQDYDGTILSQQRQFIREGCLFVQEDKKNRIPHMKKSDAQERVLLVFNDRLLFCKKNFSLASKNYNLKFLFELETDVLIVSATYLEHAEHEISLLLENRKDEKRAWMIFFENGPEKNAWLKVLQETINTEKKKKLGKLDAITIPTELFHLDTRMIREKDLRTLLTLVLSPSGISIKNRKVRLKTYKNCFLGKDLVNWLCDNEITADRQSAIIIGQKFIDLKYIKHAAEENGTFKDDSNSPYRFDSISMERDNKARSRTRSQGPENRFIKSSSPLAKSGFLERSSAVRSSSVSPSEDTTASTPEQQVSVNI